jgi:hypothetical protein
VHTHTLLDIARQRRADVLEGADRARRARLAPRRRAPWRSRLAAAFTSTGRALLTVGSTLAQDSE